MLGVKQICEEASQVIKGGLFKEAREREREREIDSLLIAVRLKVGNNAFSFPHSTIYKYLHNSPPLQ